MYTQKTVIQLKNIKPQKRVCYQCGRKIIGRGHYYITAIDRGKYLCRNCEQSAT